MPAPAALGSSSSPGFPCPPPTWESRTELERAELELSPHPVFPSASSVHPGNACKGKSHTGSGRKSRLMKTVQTMKSYGNYQNCTIVRPHIPHSYGTYVTLAPKVLVFPIFVQVSAAGRGLGCGQCPGWGQAAMQGSLSQQYLPWIHGSLSPSALLWSWLYLAQCWGLSQRELCPAQAILCCVFCLLFSFQFWPSVLA